MSKIDVQKETLKFQKLMQKDNSIITLRDEYLIPDTHPDVQEVLMIDAQPIIISKDINGSRISIEGEVEYNIIYIPREDLMTISAVKYIDKFSTNLDIENPEHKIICDIDCKVEHIELKVMNERKIEIEGTLILEWDISKEEDFDIVKSIESNIGIETLKNTEPINRIVESREVELISKSIIRVGMDKPQIDKIISHSALIHKRDVRIIDDKMQLSCYCSLKILYSTMEGKDTIMLEDDVYISKEEELTDISSDMVTYDSFQLDKLDIVVEEDDLGEARIINTDFSIKADVKIFTKEDIEIINDAYSTKFPIKITKEQHDIPLIHSIKKVESVIKDNLYIKEGDLIPEQIKGITANIKIKEESVQDNRVNIEGVLATTVLYKSSNQDKGYGMISGDIPFNITIDNDGINPNMYITIKCFIDSIEARIEANTIAVKASIITTTKVSYEVKKQFISDIFETDDEVKKQNASVTIYVLGKDETLWSLAKKFNTTVDELIKINSIEDSEELNEGDKLIIPGRAIF